MSTENHEEHDRLLPDIPPGHPANAGMIGGVQNIVSAPPIAGGKPLLVEPAAAAKVSTAQAADAAAPVAKVRKARAPKAKDEAADAAKAPRKPRVTANAAEVGPASPSAEAAKPARSRRSAVSKGATIQEQSQPAAGPASANIPDIPPMTDEAIAFLNKPDATAADLFKLQPESQKFVQFHITTMQRWEAESALSRSHLMATAQKFSPEFEKVADALVTALVKGRRAGTEPPAVQATGRAAAPLDGSYRAVPEKLNAYQLVGVKLGKMEIGLGQGADQQKEVGAAQALTDIRLANRIMATAHSMMSAPIGDVTSELAADSVAGDLDDVRVIKDKRALLLALNAMIESGHAQPHYQAAFERLAPDMVGPAKQASVALEATRDAPGRSAPRAGAPSAENTIERGIAPELENQQAKASQQVPPSVGPATPAHGLGRRMLLAVGQWLQSKAGEKAAPAPAPGGKPVSLDTPAPGLAPAPASTAPADDKTHLVPEAVARRFLKVEQDYYFPDKTLAFSDRGNKLATRAAHPEVVRSLIEIAQARGWDSITVKGTDEFRRSAWMEAAQVGLTVAGYKPTARDLADLARKPASNTVEKGDVKWRDVSATQEPLAQSAKAPAAAQAQAAGTSKAAEPAQTPELAAKARAFDKEKPGFVVKKFPELSQAYGVVDAAKKFAEANLSPDVRDDFVSLARRHVMQKILAGEHVKGPQIYAAPTKTKDGADRAQTPTQAAVDQAKAPRSKEVARER